MIPVILYTTAGCHLCELADNLLQQINQNLPLTIKHTEIGDDDELVEKYGITIPVVEFANGHQLNWPFTLDEIIAQINNDKH
jgi:glutaredoxin